MHKSPSRDKRLINHQAVDFNGSIDQNESATIPVEKSFVFHQKQIVSKPINTFAKSKPEHIDTIHSDDFESVDLTEEEEYSPARAKVLERIRDIFYPQHITSDDRSKFDSMLQQQNEREKKRKKLLNVKETVFSVKEHSLFSLCKKCKKNQDHETDKDEEGRKSKAKVKYCIFDWRSLYLFTNESWFRKKIVSITESKVFEEIILCLILANTFTMLIRDYDDPDDETAFNKMLEALNVAFGVCFLIECIMKIIAQGFVLHWHSYLRQKWNWIDFAVVLVWIFEVTKVSQTSVKSLRSLRVLRPLRSLRTWAALRKLIQGMIDSIPSLMNAVIFMIFVFMQFAIFSTIQFSGSYYSICRLTEAPLDDGTWPFDDADIRLCNTERQNCPENQFCGLQKEDISGYAELDYGFTTFDNFALSFLTVFQCISLEGWSKIMYDLADEQAQPIIVYVFFIFLILFGSLLLIQVFLAIFEDSLSQAEQIQLEKKQKKWKKESECLEKIKAADYFDDLVPDLHIPENKTPRQENNFHKSQSPFAENETARSLKSPENKNLRKNMSVELNDVPTIMSPTIQKLKKSKTLNQEQLKQSQKLKLERAITSIKNRMKEDKEQDGKMTTSMKSPRAKTPLSLSDPANSSGGKFLPERAQKNLFYKVCYKICTDPIFTIAISMLIIINCVVLAIDRYPISPEEVAIIDIINTVLTVTFVIEMVLKILAFGIKEYAKDTMNLFDAFISCVSLVELIVLLVQNDESGKNSSFTIFRTLRIMRFFKLSRRMKTFNIILGRIVSSLKDIITFCVLMFVFELIFIILGMQLFAKTVFLDENDMLTTQDKGTSPDLNFDTIKNAFVSVFVVFIGDDWNTLQYNYLRYNYWLAMGYFHLLLIATNIILLNLFMAILLQNFDEPLSDDDDEFTGLQKVKRQARRKFRTIITKLLNHAKKCCNCFQKVSIKGIETTSSSSENMPNENEFKTNDDPFGFITKVNDGLSKSERFTNKKIIGLEKENLKNLDAYSQISLRRQRTNPFSFDAKSRLSISQIKYQDRERSEKTAKTDIELQGKSLCLFDAQNNIRKFCKKIIINEYYDYIATVLIFVASLNLILDDPLDSPDSVASKVINTLDLVLTIVFVIEILVKIVIFGFLFNGEASFCRDQWNQLDFIVTGIALMSHLVVSGSSLSKNLKVMSVFRALRPLRIIMKNENINLEVNSLINSVPDIFNLMIITVLSLCVFAILGVSLFKGQMWSCYMDNVPEDVQSEIKTYWQCLDYGGDWVNADDNFDNVFKALKTQFVIMCAEGWIGIYQTARDSTSYYQMPVSEAQPLTIVYMAGSIAISGLFFLNMFVGVVISTFKREKEKLSHSTLLTPLERDYLEACTLAYKCQPQKEISAADNKFGYYTHKIALNVWFDRFIITCIFLNTFILMMVWFDQDEDISKVLDYFNHFLSFIFTIEAIIKIGALRADYFKSSWNVVDFAICIMSWLDFTLEIVLQLKINSAIRIVRTFRVARMIKVVRQFKELHRILMTFIYSIPSLMNVGSLLALFLYLYAVIGVYFFSDIKLQEGLNEYANFQTFGAAFLMLFMTLTGENWNSLMEDCARPRSESFVCVDEQSFEDRQVNGIQGCGKPMLAYPFFISFQIVMTFSMLNLIIAVILEAFARQLQEEDQTIQPELIEEFVKIWQLEDKEGTGFIQYQQLQNIIFSIIRKETEIQGRLIKQQGSILFNFHKDMSLKYNYLLHENLDDGSQLYKRLKDVPAMETQLKRHVRYFISSLRLPLYLTSRQGVYHFQFYDVLYAFILDMYNKNHKLKYDERQIRIQKFKQDPDIPVHFLDKLERTSPEYAKLTKLDRQLFDELDTPYFDHVVKSVEKKALIQKKIRIIHSMHNLRIKASKKSFGHMEKFNQKQLDSSHLFGAQVIMDNLKRMKERMSNPNPTVQVMTQNIVLSDAAIQRRLQFKKSILWREKDFIKWEHEENVKQILKQRTQMAVTQRMKTIRLNKQGINQNLAEQGEHGKAEQIKEPVRRGSNGVSPSKFKHQINLGVEILEAKSETSFLDSSMVISEILDECQVNNAFEKKRGIQDIKNTAFELPLTKLAKDAKKSSSEQTTTSWTPFSSNLQAQPSSSRKPTKPNFTQQQEKK